MLKHAVLGIIEMIKQNCFFFPSCNVILVFF